LKITEFLAVYAACLSSIVFIWNVVRTVPRVNVKLILGVETVNKEYISGVYICIQNPSPHTVHLSNISVLYPYVKKELKEIVLHALKFKRFPWRLGWVHSSLSNYKLEDGCPLSLEAGKSHNVFVPQKILEEIFKDSERREIAAVVQDQLGRNKYSRKFEVPEFVASKPETDT